MMISSYGGDKMYNKYSEQMKEETAIYILESGKSITIASKELEINVNTACRWINKYKKKHGIISNENKPASSDEMQDKIKDLEKQLKARDREITHHKKQLENEQEKVEILKKSLLIFMEPHA